MQCKRQRKAGHRHDRHGTLSDVKMSSESCQCRSLSYCHSSSGTWLTTDDRAFLGKSCHQPIALQSSQCQLRLRCRLLRFLLFSVLLLNLSLSCFDTTVPDEIITSLIVRTSSSVMHSAQLIRRGFMQVMSVWKYGRVLIN